MIRYNLKKKVFTFAKVKIRLLQKSIFAKVKMVDFCKSRAGRAAQRNFFELDFDFDFCKKMAKARTFFGKARKNFAKVKVKIEK
jgi:hypothetical protein